MSFPSHPRVTMMLNLMGALADAAEATARAGAKKYHKRHRTRIGGTLRPGAGTPLWNEVVAVARPQLARYGEKAKLARILGVPRQRVHEYLVANSACPDAERMLLLLEWLAARLSGKDLA